MLDTSLLSSIATQLMTADEVEGGQAAPCPPHRYPPICLPGIPHNAGKSTEPDTPQNNSLSQPWPSCGFHLSLWRGFNAALPRLRATFAGGLNLHR